MKEELGIVLSNHKIAQDTYLMKINAGMSKQMLPGQFVNIKVDGFMLRRPISISSIDSTGFTIVYKVVGGGTEKLATLKSQDTINIFGPLGSFYPIHNELDEVLLIGGGVGVPPLLEVAKQYRKLDKKVNVVLGFNDVHAKFYEDEFTNLGCATYIATMDGSYGTKGTVMDAIKENNITSDFVYSCGPMPMLRAVESAYTKGYTSFEARMACGIGACMGCVCKDKKDESIYYRICKEGPVFEIGKVGL